MTVLIGDWEFEGPFTCLEDLRSEPGLAAILTGTNDEYELIEIEESASVRSFIENHPKFNFNPSAADDKLAIAIYYCSDLNSSLRQGLVDQLMKEFDSFDDHHTSDFAELAAL